MKQIAVSEARARLCELLVEVEHGEHFLITRYGQPIARLGGAGAARRCVPGRAEKIAGVIASLRQQRRGVTLEGDLRPLIGVGRD